MKGNMLYIVHEPLIYYKTKRGTYSNRKISKPLSLNYGMTLFIAQQPTGSTVFIKPTYAQAVHHTKKDNMNKKL